MPSVHRRQAVLDGKRQAGSDNGFKPLSDPGSVPSPSTIQQGKPNVQQTLSVVHSGTDLQKKLLVARLDLTVAESRCQIQGLYPLHLQKNC